MSVWMQIWRTGILEFMSANSKQFDGIWEGSARALSQAAPSMQALRQSLTKHHQLAQPHVKYHRQPRKAPASVPGSAPKPQTFRPIVQSDGHGCGQWHPVFIQGKHATDAHRQAKMVTGNGDICIIMSFINRDLYTIISNLAACVQCSRSITILMCPTCIA